MTATNPLRNGRNLLFNPLLLTTCSLSGALLLVVFSIVQKLMAGYPLKPQGFVVPTLFGAVCGTFLYLFFHRQQKAIAQLKEQTAFLNTLLDNVEAGIMLVDPLSREIVMINQMAARTFGYPMDELIGKPCSLICPKKEHDQCAANDEAQRGKIIRRNLTRKDGTSVPVLKNATITHIEGRTLLFEAFLDLRQQIEAEQLSEDILNSMQSHLAVINKDGDILAVNEAWKQFALANDGGSEKNWGKGANYFKAAGTIERGCDDISNLGDDFITGIKTVINGDSLFFEKEYPCHSLTEQRWFLMRVSPLKGHPGHVAIAHINISKQRLAQQTALEKSQELAFIIEAAQLGTWDADLTTGFAHYNNQWRNILGYSEEEVEPDSTFWWNNIHPDDQPMIQDYIERHLSEEISIYRTTFRMRHKSGDWRWILSQGRITQRSTDHTPLRAAGIHLDITEKQEQYLTLLQHQQVIEQATESVLITDTNGNILFANRSFEKMTGYLLAECLGEKPSLFIKPDLKKDIGAILQIITSGGVWNDHLDILTKEGKHLTTDTSIAPIFSNNGSIINYVAFSRDVTQKLLLKQQLYKAQKMEALGILVSGISHDFNNMLTPIMGYTEMLLRGFSESDPNRKFLEEIFKAAIHSRDLIKQLLAFGKKQQLHSELLNPREVITGIKKLLQHSLRNDITLQVNLPDACDPVVMDRGQIEQVLMNLVINARDALNQGGTILLSLEEVTLDDQFCLTYQEVRPGPYCAISVTDNGGGMSEETLLHVFEPYFSTKAEMGTGMGLATVYGIISQHHGCITIDTAPGKGTCITVYLPTEDKTDPTQVSRQSTLQKPPCQEEKRATILVVDDDKNIITMVSQMLTANGHAIYKAEDGASALALLSQHPDTIDLVVSDLDMPRLNGTQLHSLLRQHYPDVAMIIMSGYIEPDLARYTDLKDTQISFLKKPFQMSSLLDAVQKELAATPEHSTDNPHLQH